MPFITDRLHSARPKRQFRKVPAEVNTFDTSLEAVNTNDVMLKSRFSFDIGIIDSELRRSIVGQDRVVNELLNILKVVRADIGNPRKPLASILFCGPTGVGKTETARTVARALYGDEDAMCRIDMNTLSQEHYAASFTGAPPGYVGSKEGTTILDQVKIEGTHCLPGVVLLDELEKASNEVILALMNVFDNGILTVASGERTFSFRNAIIFMSSNLGARELLNLEGDPSKLLSRLRRPKDRNALARDMVMKKLLERFPPEFVNRIDCVDTFNWLDRETIPKLVDRELEQLNQRLHKHSVFVTIDESARNYLSMVGYSKNFGARSLQRAMRRHLEFPLASFLLKSDTNISKRVRVGISEISAAEYLGSINFRFVDN